MKAKDVVATVTASAKRRGARRRGEITTRSAAVRLFRAVEPNGVLTERALFQRIGYLLDLVSETAEREITAHWNQTDVERLAASKHMMAYKAWGTTFGWPSLPGHAPSRVGWAALEIVGRTVRSSAHRRGIIEALLSDTPLPPRSDEVSIRNNQRRIECWTTDHGRKPASFWEMEPDPPHLPRQAVLSATDKQFLVIGNDLAVGNAPVTSGDSVTDRVSLTDRVSMSILLPTQPDPQTRVDWTWHDIPIKRPDHMTGEIGRPTLRLKGKRIIADMPFTTATTIPRHPGVAATTRILAIDWGVNTPLVASVTERLLDGTISTDGRPLHFSAPGLSTKIHILHRQIHFLTDKINRIGEMLGVAPDDRGLVALDTGKLSRKRHVLWTERDRVSDRLSHLDQEFSHLSSRWAIEQALALDCGGVAVENLASLEPTKHGKHQNERHAQSPKSQIIDKIEYKSIDAGLSFVKVNPRGTSSQCSRCGETSRHTTAPDSTKPGYRWLRCTACGISLDRDHAGSERIGARALDPTTPIVIVKHAVRRESLDIATLPARGPRARHRRSRIEGRRACSVVTPPQPGMAGHRAVGAGPETTFVAQVCMTVNPRRTDPRRLDGMRSAYLGGIHVSPIRRLIAVQMSGNQLRQVDQ